MRSGADLLAVVALCGCATTNGTSVKVYSPDEVLEMSEKLDGQPIYVRGWLGGCLANDNRICGLYSNRKSALSSQPREWPLPVEASNLVDISFTRQVIAQGKYVVTCRADATTICLEYDGHFYINSVRNK